MTGRKRDSWTSGLTFVLATAGAAIGLGNIWRFPYITGQNGGGLFVLIYLGALVVVGLPIMIAEVLTGRAAQVSTVPALRKLAGPRSPWVGLGWLGLIGSLLVLSFYAVVSAWILHYVYIALSGQIGGRGSEEIQALFGGLVTNVGLNLSWLAVFMLLTMGVVLAGVRRGLERWLKVMMPVLLLLLLALLVRSAFLEGFGEGVRFVFGLRADQLTGAGVLEALGHAFFTLGAGLGGLLTYGSYLDPDVDIPHSSLRIVALDTLVALGACLVLFPIVFSYGLEPDQGPGMIFVTLTTAFGQMPGGGLLATTFFVLLFVAALTSSVSILEVSAAFFIDDRGWSRGAATLTAGAIVTLLAVPCALSGANPFLGQGLRSLIGTDWFGMIAGLATNWMAPIGGLGLALFVGWRLGGSVRESEFGRGSVWARFYRPWLWTVRFVIPAAVTMIFLHAIGVI